MCVVVVVALLVVYAVMGECAVVSCYCGMCLYVRLLRPLSAFSMCRLVMLFPACIHSRRSLHGL
jgi:hypothetical protein